MNREKRLLLLFVLISVLLSSFNKNTATDLVIEQKQNPILFIHGGGGDITNWEDMIERFKNDGWPNSSLFAYNFENSPICTAQQNIDNANMIKQWVGDILETTGANKIDIVAHSMGGLSSRYYIKYLADYNNIDDYVTLGSPHHGVDLHNCVYSSDTPTSFMISLNEGDETPGGILNDVVGDKNDTILGVTYNGTHIPGNISYTSIYSSDDEYAIPSYNISYLDGALNVLVQGLSHMELVLSQVGYELVLEAVEDQYTSSTTTSTTTTTTTLTTTSQSTGMTYLAIFLGLILVIKLRKKRINEGNK